MHGIFFSFIVMHIDCAQPPIRMVSLVQITCEYPISPIMNEYEYIFMLQSLAFGSVLLLLRFFEAEEKYNCEFHAFPNNHNSHCSTTAVVWIIGFESFKEKHIFNQFTSRVAAALN